MMSIMTPIAGELIAMAQASRVTNRPNVQGVERTAVKMPKRKFPRYVSWLAPTFASAL